MASLAAYNVIHDYLVVNWLTPLPTLRFENDGQDPPADASPFIYVEIESVSDDQASIGGGDSPDANLWREEGTVFFDICIQRGTLTSQGRTWRDQLARLFKGLKLSGLTFRTQRFLGGESLAGTGNYYRLPLAIDFHRDH